MSRIPATGVLVALLLAGCNSEPPPPEPAQVSGKITVGGKPVGKAHVRFHSLAESTKTAFPETTRTEEDGTFKLTVRPGAGEYAVTVSWPVITFAEPGQKGEEVEGDDRLQGKYNIADKPATKVTLKGGENSLPTIALKAP